MPFCAISGILQLNLNIDIRRAQSRSQNISMAEASNKGHFQQPFLEKRN
jgi:hypothetical protein